MLCRILSADMASSKETPRKLEVELLCGCFVFGVQTIYVVVSNIFFQPYLGEDF